MSIQLNPRSRDRGSVRDRATVFREIKSAVARERESTMAVLRLLREVDCDRHFLAAGYPSLFEFAIRELGYSAGAAHRRIQSMRLLKDLPEVESQLESGELSLCVAAKTQSFLKNEARRRKESGEERLELSAKRELVQSLVGVSSREAERKLISLSPEAALPKESTRPVSEDKTLIQFLADRELMEKLDRLKGLLAHQNFAGRYDELFKRLADMALQKFDPIEKARTMEVKAMKKAQTMKVGQKIRETVAISSVGSTARIESFAFNVENLRLNKTSTSIVGNPERVAAPAINKVSPKRNFKPNPRYIPAAIRRQVWLRDQGVCTYRDPQSGQKCASRHALEFDHREPFAYGGEHTPENLRLRCRAHNEYTAERAGLSRAN